MPAAAQKSTLSILTQNPFTPLVLCTLVPAPEKWLRSLPSVCFSSLENEWGEHIGCCLNSGLPEGQVRVFCASRYAQPQPATGGLSLR